jgi:ankyrin repeat protein
MRLLQIGDNGELSLVERLGSIPSYAILSHTWGPPSEEITYQDMLNNTAKAKAAYPKIQFCVQQAIKDNLKYFWIDTCCIDKSSSAELSEAITSMFRWYQSSAQCYVYLSDVSSRRREADYDTSCFTWESNFRNSRWFSRGWTLQELLAPRSLTFFSNEGQNLGDKSSLEQIIHEITQIPIQALRTASLKDFDTNERLSWAQKRQTTREEDEAYSLLGIFGISMLPIYGEGRESALKRLHKEISDTSEDRNEERRRAVLNSLRFYQMDTRHMTIKNAHTNTCRWLLTNSKYIDWLDATKLDEHHGFLWIKGKPGTGKSTLMKFALANAYETMREFTVISFFFNARGAELEKSTIGTYRSLLLQLLEKLPALQDVFDLFGPSTISLKSGHMWSIESLKSLIEKTIRALGKSSLVCIVDALDECEEDEVRDMIQFFEHIGNLAVSTGLRFQTLFSSRHYPYISVRKGLDLVLERQAEHTEDITKYLRSELRIGDSKDAQSIRVELQEKASGIFMWVVIVISILNKEYDAGRIFALRRRLRELPSNLHDLFSDILTRDSLNKEELVLCLKWALFSKQLLSPKQLYFAILSGTEPETVTWLKPDQVTMSAVQRFILNASKGLIDVVSTAELQRVQFIHESVRDFLLTQTGLGNIWPELKTNFEGQGHERLKQCCFTYMQLDVSAHMTAFESLLRPSRQQVKELHRDVRNDFPLLEYAVHHVLYHAEAAEGSGITQKSFINSFPVTRWITLHNLFTENEAYRHASHATLLYILAELNMKNLIAIYLSLEARYGVEHEQHSSNIDKEGGLGGNPLQIAALRGYKEIVVLLLKAGARVDVEGGHYGNALQAASLNGHMEIIRLLLNNNANVNAQGGYYGNALQAASLDGHMEIITLLLKNNANVNAQGGLYGNAIQAASFGGHTDIVRLLLNNNADVNAHGGLYGNALQAASLQRHIAIVQLLLERNANVNAQGGHYGNALQAASVTGSVKIVKLLLENGADINAQCGQFDYALHAACYRGHEDVVELLLDRGAEVALRSRHDESAIETASRSGQTHIKELLISHGASRTL